MTTPQIDAVNEAALTGRDTRDLLLDDDCAPAPPKILVYRSPAGGFVESPPSGKLDGWEARSVDEGAWRAYRDADNTAREARRTLARVEKHELLTYERIEREWAQA